MELVEKRLFLTTANDPYTDIVAHDLLKCKGGL